MLARRGSRAAGLLLEGGWVPHFEHSNILAFALFHHRSQNIENERVTIYKKVRRKLFDKTPSRVYT